MFEHALETAESLAGGGAGKITAVFRPGMEPTATVYASRVRAVYQEKQRGTGHALKTAVDAGLPTSRIVLVLYGDTPLVKADTLRAMTQVIENGASVCVAGFRTSCPGAYGRLMAGEGNALERIVEFKDANAEQRAVTLCNSGVMALRSEGLEERLTALTPNNAGGEYYLTDLVALARARGERCAYVEAEAEEFVGVNDRVELAKVEAIFQQSMRERAMRGGATLIAPDTVFFAADTEIGQDVVVEPHVFFGLGVRLGDGVRIKAFSTLEGCAVSSGAVVGPYARLRPGAKIGEGARIGNFVEVKNASVGTGAKINHLSYVGDATVGTGANIGAGAVTCNYDGTKKSRTDIGREAFIGSNAALVAPVRIGARARVAAGSVITDDVSDDSLAIARSRQIEKKDYYG